MSPRPMGIGGVDGRRLSPCPFTQQGLCRRVSPEWCQPNYCSWVRINRHGKGTPEEMPSLIVTGVVPPMSPNDTNELSAVTEKNLSPLRGPAGGMSQEAEAGEALRLRKTAKS